MMIENEALKAIVKSLFPSPKFYINDVPKEFTRPCFVFIDPEDHTDVKELSRFACRQTKTITLYHFYTEDDYSGGEAVTMALLSRLNGEPKHPLPGLDRRYMAVTATADINKVSSLVTFTIKATRTLPREHIRPSAPKIERIIHTIGGEEFGKRTEHSRRGKEKYHGGE